MTKKEQILNDIKNIANSNHPDSEVILFGSQARGDSNNYSDWDILILLNRPNIPFDEETKIMDDYYELELNNGIVISPLIYTKKDWTTKYALIPLHDNIQKEGIKIK